MKCRRVQKLIPLYVEGDLGAGVATRITAHLEWCGRCNWLADEYRESQSWLRGAVPPVFDKALLDDVKTKVLTEIAAVRQRPSTLAAFVQRWNRRQVLALSTATLIVLGMIIVYVYQALPKPGGAGELTEEVMRREPAPSKDPDLLAGAKPAPGAGSRDSHPAPIKRRRTVPRLFRSAAPIEPEPSVLSEVSDQAPTTRLDRSASGSTDSREMLRIEIQTSDPLVRIIWFAPKEIDPHQSKPATD